jgi:hypothetical protein
MKSSIRHILSQCNTADYFKKEYVFLALIVTLMFFSFLGSNMTLPQIFHNDATVEGYSDKLEIQSQKAQAQAQSPQPAQEVEVTNNDNNIPLVKEKFPSSGIYIGIPRSQIPVGQEDLYIRKSQVVPPVCPECPPLLNQDVENDKCPPCASCKRCPEPAFICKEIPSDSTNPSANAYLPRPVLTNFGEFGL